MTTTTLLLSCLLVGQAVDGSRLNSSLPVPAAPQFPQTAPPVVLGSRFGEPTPATPNPFQPQLIDPDSQIGPPARTIPFLQAPQVIGTRPRELGTGVQAATAASPGANYTVAMELVQEAFVQVGAGGEAKSLTLRDVVAAHRDYNGRLAAIRTYWEALTLLADLHFAREEAELIKQLWAAGDEAAAAKVAAAQAASAARLVEAEMAATSAQLALAEIVASSGAGAPPVPTDRPLVGSYTTRFETLYGTRPAPPSARRIHGILPLRHQLVLARAASAEASRRALEVQLSSGGDERSRVSATLNALAMLRHERGAFLGAVRDYNIEIAEYALTLARPEDPAERVVSMLIDVNQPAANLAQQPGRSVLVSSPGGVVSASATAPPQSPVFAAPGEVSILRNGAPQPVAASPSLPLNSPRVAQQDDNRPATSRVLGTFRDVTGQQPTPAEPASGLPPRSVIRQGADVTPSLPMMPK